MYIYSIYIYSRRDFDYLQKYETLRSLGAGAPRKLVTKFLSFSPSYVISSFRTFLFFSLFTIIYYQLGVRCLTIYAVFFIITILVYINYVYYIYIYIYIYICMCNVYMHVFLRAHIYICILYTYMCIYHMYISIYISYIYIFIYV